MGPNLLAMVLMGRDELWIDFIRCVGSEYKTPLLLDSTNQNPALNTTG